MISIPNLYNLYLSCNKISIDSRKVKLNDIFFGLKGPIYNGSSYAKKALLLGAKYAIVDDISFYDKSDTRIIYVEDSLETLRQLALYHRNLFKIPFIAITGSSGKTTTKELTKKLLSIKYKVFATKGNYNSKTGLPITLLDVPKDTEIVILEMGASEPGNIKNLCEIAKPTHGLITAIKEVHLEGFKNIEGVLNGKLELFNYLKKNKGTIFFNISDEKLASRLKDFPNCILYSSNLKDYKEQKSMYIECGYITNNTSPYLKYCIKNEYYKNSNYYETKILGNFNINNIASALCIAKFFNVDLSKCHTEIKKYKSFSNRLEEIKLDNNNLVILDAYNSNYESLKNSINIINNYKYERKVLVLGQMNELYDKADLYHKQIVIYVQSLKIDDVIFWGDKFYQFKDLCKGACFLNSSEKITQYFKIEKYKNSLILLKASRSYKFENLIKTLHKI